MSTSRKQMLEYLLNYYFFCLNEDLYFLQSNGILGVQSAAKVYKSVNTMLLRPMQMDRN